MSKKPEKTVETSWGGAVSTNVPDVDTNVKVSEEEDGTIQDDQARHLINEPLLIRESTAQEVPQTLALTYERSQATSAHEALFAVLHVLMTETGCQAPNNNYLMPDGWRKAGGIFKVDYRVPDGTSKTATLTYIRLGNTANVLCTASGSEVKHQQQLTHADYVIAVNANAHDTYKNLSKLSTLFKDKVSYPMLQTLRSGSESPLPSLSNLMMELQLLILKNLKAKDLLRLSTVSSHFSSLCSDKMLWRRLYLKDFGRRVNNNELSQDWLKLYKEKFVIRDQLQKNRQFITDEMIDPFPFRNPYADLQSLQPGARFLPGVVGGEYDLNPNFGAFGPQPPSLFTRARFDPVGPHPDMDRRRSPLPDFGPPLPGFGPRSRRDRRDPGFGFGGGFGGGFM